MKRLKGLLRTIGINPERLQFYNLSAAMGPRWAEICNEFTEKIIALGPSPIWLARQKKKESLKHGE
ncbi:coenzyme F420-reducing hydrogenase delta subunit [Desulfoprunum benzoelyticum]|uniref:Coenzyme F420-reducing hydrogenase delta subunit n=1 Tax=Desulfoprunum benzoelyticum TaxID=1506996 RepID=A0A840UWZ1_9BACT|nr:coenzyme F420-reducing hydrogenase delta subunit [Desulfoprunum benzoelyticum]